jgi:hypothetical protein
MYPSVLWVKTILLLLFLLNCSYTLLGGWCDCAVYDDVCVCFHVFVLIVFLGNLLDVLLCLGIDFNQYFFWERYLGDGGMVDTCFLLAGDRADLKTIVNLVTNIGWRMLRECHQQKRCYRSFKHMTTYFSTHPIQLFLRGACFTYQVDNTVATLGNLWLACLSSWQQNHLGIAPGTGRYALEASYLPGRLPEWPLLEIHQLLKPWDEKNIL